MPLFLLFVAVPLIEIALFVRIGGAIGLGWTLAIVFGTAVLGTWLIRNQGTMAMNDLRRSLNELRDPSEPLAHGAMIIFAGALLLTPGFLTDSIGFLLLLPPVRQAIIAFLRSRMRVRGVMMRAHRESHGPEGDIIDVEYREITPEESGPGREGAEKH